MRDILDADAADLHREVDDGHVDRREDHEVDDDGNEPRQHVRRWRRSRRPRVRSLPQSCVPTRDFGRRERPAATAARCPYRWRDRAIAARDGCSTRPFAGSGVARRTASGWRGGDGLVISGSSSVIGRPKSGSSSRCAVPLRATAGGVRNADHAVEIGPRVHQARTPRRQPSPHRRARDRRADRATAGRCAARGREWTARTARSARNRIRSCGSGRPVRSRGSRTLDTSWEHFMERCRSACSPSGGNSAGTSVNASSCRWMSARSRSASAFCGSVGRTDSSERQRVAQVTAGGERARAAERVSPRRGSGSARLANRPARPATARAIATRPALCDELDERAPVDPIARRRDRSPAATIATPSSRNTTRPIIDRGRLPLSWRALPRARGDPRGRWRRPAAARFRGGSADRAPPAPLPTARRRQSPPAAAGAPRRRRRG